MKSFLMFFIAGLFMAVSCSKESSSEAQGERKTSVFTTYDIGYLDDGDEFVEITETEYRGWILDVLEIDDSVTIVWAETSLDDDDDGNFTLHTIFEASYTGKSYRVRDVVSYASSTYRLEGETCTCESSGCGFNGCEVIASPGNCSCTSCPGGSCTKKHTVTQDPSQMFL